MSTSNRTPEYIRNGVYGVLGHQIAYSRSPYIFRRVFRELGWRARYELFDLPPQSLARFFREAKVNGTVGLSVTKPHKTRVIDHLDRWGSNEAGIIGAVNTIAIRHGRMIGYNTDVDGIAASLSPYRNRLSREHALVFGAGGAARAVLFVLASEFKMHAITVVVRSIRKWKRSLDELGERLGSRVDISVFAPDNKTLGERIAEAMLIVNATPVGSGSLRTQSPMPAGLHFNPRTVVFDLVYRQRVTPFLRQARRDGCVHSLNGWTMLVNQAEASFRIWTGRSFPASVRRELLAERGTA